jgi:hypothetical protein
MKFTLFALSTALLGANAFQPSTFGVRPVMQLQSTATETKAFPKLPASVKVGVLLLKNVLNGCVCAL